VQRVAAAHLELERLEVARRLLGRHRVAQDALEAAGRLVKKAKVTRNTAVADTTPEGAAKGQLSRAAGG